MDENDSYTKEQHDTIVRIRDRLTKLRDDAATQQNKEGRVLTSVAGALKQALYYPLGYPQLLVGEYAQLVAVFEENLSTLEEGRWQLADLAMLVESAEEIVWSAEQNPARETFITIEVFPQIRDLLKIARDAFDAYQLDALKDDVAALKSGAPRPFASSGHVRYQIFLSSTFADLVDERNQVTQAILRMGKCIPAGMELFGADSQPPWDAITRVLDITDYFVLVLANRYGSILDNGSNRSYTEKEYDYAVEHKIPVLAFIADKKRAALPDHVDSGKSKAALERFKTRVNKNHTTTTWMDSASLAQLVTDGLWKAFEAQPRPGWIRGTTV